MTSTEQPSGVSIGSAQRSSSLKLAGSTFLVAVVVVLVNACGSSGDGVESSVTPTEEPTDGASPTSSPDGASDQAVVIEEWVAGYDGERGDDKAKGIAVDDAGNVYVAGDVAGDDWSLVTTIKYGPDGTEQWNATLGLGRVSGLAVDDLRNVYVAGTAFEGGLFTVKYGPDGTKEWQAAYADAISISPEDRALALDADGNVYVTGNIESDTDEDYVTIKYGPDGSELWVARYDGGGPSGSGDSTAAIAVDDEGNAYVTGTSRDLATASQGDIFGALDVVTVKYGPDGSEMWVARYDGPDGTGDQTGAVAADDEGNVYVPIESVDSDAEYVESVVIKYGPDGGELWVASVDIDTRDLAVDRSGYVYATGRGFSAVKLAPDGSVLWESSYEGTEVPQFDVSDSAELIAVDEGGNVIVAGYSFEPDTFSDFTTIKFSPDGARLWLVRYDNTQPGDPIGSSEGVSAMTIDADGNVYVTGRSEGPGTDFDFATVKYRQEP